MKCLKALCLTPVLAMLSVATAQATTYTIEPFDLDGDFGIVQTVTQAQLGGSLCPCVKIPYPADGWNNPVGVAGIAAAPLVAGDTVIGFSNGSAVISTYLATHTPPPGVNFILLGDTPTFNAGSGSNAVPADVSVPVTFVVRQYDGWTDFPDNMNAPGYLLAVLNALAGAGYVHNYISVQLDSPANVVAQSGNITTVLVPTQNLPVNNWLRDIGLPSVADSLDVQQRPLVDAAYTRPSPTATQLAASTGEQVTSAPLVQTPEPVLASAPKVAATSAPKVVSTTSAPKVAPKTHKAASATAAKPSVKPNHVAASHKPVKASK